MVTEQLISPKSIVVVGGSEDTSKPGGSALKNLIDNKYSGKLYVVNPKAENVQWQKTYHSISELPEVDCAILAIPAKMCVDAVRELCSEKNCKAVIIFSAGFNEESAEGAKLEKEIVEIVDKYGASLIGPNCIGVITNRYSGVFTQPTSNVSEKGIDIISGSGATVVFIMEAAIKLGLTFSNVFSVGNSAQLGVEEILEYLDENYVPGVSSPVKLLYIENISKPHKLLKHARSLILKGARIAAIKAGYSEVGSRAASSHTGALASPDTAVDALFRKAGIIRAYGRDELVNIASVLTYPAPKGKKMAIVTHAGGPAVMLTDVLSSNGIEIPKIEGEDAQQLLSKLFHGSSVSNPIDFLATGTPQQLGEIIDACENKFDVDAITVIFGSPGLTDVYPAYKVLLEKMKCCKKPIYPVLPSVVNAGEAIAQFQKAGGISFPDEVTFGNAFVKVANTPLPEEEESSPAIDEQMIREVIDANESGYLPPAAIQRLLDAAGINRAKEVVVRTVEEAAAGAREVGYPLVMKVIGPVHKTDVGGVSLNVADDNTLITEFNRMIKIKDTTAILLQPMLSGTEIFIGAKREGNFGNLVMCGLGGIFIEVLKDVSTAMSPVGKVEAQRMIKSLRGYKMIEGARGMEGVNEALFIDAIRRVSALCMAAPEIEEMDLNPLLGNAKEVVAVDARIRICKKI
ncbi:MAG: acetate--CoA ligase family protein [Bacteroidales bacterium]|nr:acetate--CoA ligase family protein [Bacteroidales bacterium]